MNAPALPERTPPAEAALPPGPGWPHNRRQRLWIEAGLVVGFWTLLALLMAGNDLLDARDHLVPERAPRVMLHAVLRFALWAALTPGIFWLCRRFPLERPGLAARALLHVALAFAVSFVVDAYDDFLRLLFAQPRPAPLASFDPFGDLFELGFLYEFVIYVATLAAGFARDYFLRFEARRQEAARFEAQATALQAHAARLERQLTEARLEALRMQINPHFLFNTLHAVSALVDEDPKGVRRMIARLSRLLRYVLEETGEQEVPLQQELRFLENYLDIMQIRFQGRLRTHLDAPPDALHALVPNLILQPLVENAVKHGAGEAERPARVEVRAQRRGHRLLLSVHDDGPRFAAGGAPALAGGTGLNEGTGLKNVRARLNELYGPDAVLRFRAAEGGGLIAEIALPFHTGGDLRTQARPAEPAPSAASAPSAAPLA